MGGMQFSVVQGDSIATGLLKFVNYSALVFSD